MLTQFSKPGALVAVVSDSYDLFNAITNIWGTELKQQIIESGGTLVVRPDSGVPEEIVPQCLCLLADKFGYTMNSKGYRVLPSYVRLIQGDGINLQSLSTIINAIHAVGFSLDNVAFGMGGGLLQQVDRDTQQWAMKCSAVQVNNLWRDVYKAPITSSAKRSKKGVLAVVKEGGVFKSIKKDDLTNDVQHNWLEPVFIDGHLLVEDDFSTIKNRLHP
jgi:nicotinamide phosphoribosyltransferase